MRTCTPTPFKITAISCILKTPQESNTDRRINYILRKICKHLLVEESALKGKTQITDVVDARYIAIHFVFTMIPDLGYVRVGKIFNRDRSTVYYALTKVQDLQFDKKFKKKFDLINNSLN